jgi:hypothetical protein
MWEAFEGKEGQLRMFSLEEADIFFKESALELDLMHHRNQMLIDQYTVMYLEDGNTSGGSDEVKTGKPRKKGVVNVIIEKIKAMLERIYTAICGFLDGIRMGSKNRLSADEYMASDEAQIRLSMDVDKVIAQVEEEHLQSRKIVQAISSGTKIPADAIAQFCDTVDETIRENKDTIVSTARPILRAAVVEGRTRHLTKIAEEKKGYIKKTQACIDAINKRHDVDPKDLNALERFVTYLGKSANKAMDTYTRINSELIHSKVVVDKKMAKKKK